MLTVELFLMAMLLSVVIGFVTACVASDVAKRLKNKRDGAKSG